MKDDWKTVFPAPQSEITAVDILLEPDATMLDHCKADNARLLGAYPQGFALDATHTPHITLLQCFVRTVDLDNLYAAEGKVLAAANVTAMKLEAFKRYYLPAGGGWRRRHLRQADAGNPQVQADIIAAASPFNLRSGPIEAFTAGTIILPWMRPSSVMCPSLSRLARATISIRTSAPATRRPPISTRWSPSPLNPSPSRPQARPFTSLAPLARRRSSSNNGI